MKKEKVLGCGCFVIILIATIIGAFLFGTYYGKDIVAKIKNRTERIYNKISDGVDDVGDGLKDVVDDVKDSVDDVGKHDSYIVD